MKLESLMDLYLQELQDVYDAENQIVKALPKVAKAASSRDLQTALEAHFEQTKSHVKRLETIFAELGVKAKTKKCEGIRGILEEDKELLGQEGSRVVDAGLIAGAQRVEHYEMAVYGSLRTWAEQLGDDRAVTLLEQTLDEEKEADAKLTEIAQQHINREAAQNVNEASAGR